MHLRPGDFDGGLVRRLAPPRLASYASNDGEFVTNAIASQIASSHGYRLCRATALEETEGPLWVEKERSSFSLGDVRQGFSVRFGKGPHWPFVIVMLKDDCGSKRADERVHWTCECLIRIPPMLQSARAERSNDYSRSSRSASRPPAPSRPKWTDIVTPYPSKKRDGCQTFIRSFGKHHAARPVSGSP